MNEIRSDVPPTASLTIGPGLQVDLYLRFSKPHSLMSLSMKMTSLACLKEGFLDVSAMLHYVEPDVPRKTLLRCSSPSSAEKIVIAFGGERDEANAKHIISSLVWEGDAEYWLECAEKCARLSQAEKGFQDLIVRNNYQQVEITLDLSEQVVTS